MWAIEHHPEIAFNDLNDMRCHYKDYLRLKNFETEDINNFLKEFDTARETQNYIWIFRKMKEIGVKIIL